MRATDKDVKADVKVRPSRTVKTCRVAYVKELQRRSPQPAPSRYGPLSGRIHNTQSIGPQRFDLLYLGLAVLFTVRETQVPSRRKTASVVPPSPGSTLAAIVPYWL